MSLDKLKIAPFLVRELYAGVLIEDSHDHAKKHAPFVAETSLKYLGNNGKHILILANEKDHLFLADDELNFLMTILNACHITMADVALVNVYNNADAVYQNLKAELSPAVILFFDAQPQHLDFPLQIPFYRVHSYDGIELLTAPSLKILAAAKEEKKQLWPALKKIFTIA